MDQNEITALNRCSQDIKSSVIVSSKVLQKLEYRGIISKLEKQNLMQERNGCDRNSKLVDIMKKKTGGFQAFTEALLQEKISNEHFVNKMRNTYLKILNSKQRVVPEDSKQANNMRHSEQKFKEYENFCIRVSSLVLGHDATFDEETINKDAVIIYNELEQTRQILNMRELGLHETVSAFKMNFEREKTDLSQMSKKREDGLKKSLDEVNEKLAIMSEDMRMLQKHHDEIILDLVEAEVKKRLMTFSQRTLFTEPPLSLNPETIETDNDPDGSHQTDQSIPTSTETARTQPLFSNQHIHYFQNVQTVQINHDGKNISETVTK